MMKGSPAFASIFQHQQIIYSRRDDLEALGYTFLKLELGELYWVTEFDEL